MSDWIMVGIFTLMFGGIGGMLIVKGTTEFFAQRRVLSTAVPVEATILSARVITSRSSNTDRRLLRDNSTTSHLPEVRFAYEYQGVRYESDQLYPTVIQCAFASSEAAAAEIAEYTPGSVVNAFVGSAQPERGFLRMTKSNGPIWFVIAGCLCFVFLGVFYWIA